MTEPGPRARMPCSQWRQLSSKAKTIWDQLDNASKAIILRPTQNPKRSPKEDQTNHGSLNWHDTSSDDHDNEHGETEETFEDAVHEQEFAPDAMLARMSERKPQPPGDLKRLLSQKTWNKGTTDAKDQQPAEIEVNGLKYRQVKMRRMRYQCTDRTPSSRDDNHVFALSSMKSNKPFIDTNHFHALINEIDQANSRYHSNHSTKLHWNS